MTKPSFIRHSLSILPVIFSVSFPQLAKADNFPVIVVTPTRIETEQIKSPVPVEVITRQQIENSMSQDVADITKMYAGLEVARNGDYGKVTSLFVRGTESNHTVVLVDGVKINPATIGSAAIQNISPSIIDHIEIVKGPRSSVYGSEAIGGVVNIITKKQVSGAHGSVSLGAGDNSSQSANVDFSYGKNNFSSGIVLEAFTTDGFPGADDSTRDHGYENDTLNAFVTYKTNAHQINLRHWQTTGNVEYYSYGELNQDYSNSATTLQWGYDTGDMFGISIRASQVKDIVEQQVENFLSDLDKAETARDEFDLKMDFKVNSKSTFSMGILKAVEQVDALSFGTLIDEETDIDELYALYQANQSNHNYAVSLRNTEHEGFGQHNTWNFDYQYNLEPEVRLYAGIGTAFRAPDNTDRFGFGGNPDLSPETSRNTEVGLIFDLSQNSLLKLSVFKNTLKDLIVLTGAWPNYKMENIEEAEITGFEISFNQQSDEWQFQVNALLQNPVNKTSDEMLSRRAESTVNTQVSYHQPLWQVSANASSVSARDDSSFNEVTLPRYEIVNLSALYRISRNAKVSAKIDNLFNEQYETASGFNSKDRTLMLELKYNFLN
ncbi:MAG: TonB-dependent receptor [Gammaproteobacteria bacterium]|nr:TonB-dependent receptor [Gammaproteobacteria bacterium]